MSDTFSENEAPAVHHPFSAVRRQLGRSSRGPSSRRCRRCQCCCDRGAGEADPVAQRLPRHRSPRTGIGEKEEKEIGDIGRPPPEIDLLFISHFDSDHVSGLGILLGQPESPRLKVHTAVIPYVSPATGFEILATAAVQGKCTDDLIDAVTQPAKHCIQRRIQRLVIVRPRGDRPAGDETAAPSSPPTLSESRPSELSSGRVLSSVFIGPDGSVPPTYRQEGVERARG
jgi:Metallo-beta-lactamase superfamily